MIETDLQKLGDKITRLRIAKNLKQSELAYEAGISERTLQRMEAGEVVKSDGLLKVIAYLGRLDELLEAIDTPSLSPYEMARRPRKSGARKRVRAARNNPTIPGKALKKPGEIVWPEDQT
jgi:transcriptional regulator with XRE-family HTH domain